MARVASRPRLILLHGTRFDAREWDGYATLIPGATLVPLDLPGHGSRCGEPWSNQAALDQIELAVHAGREAGERVIVCGHSLGGYVATSYAQAHPGVLDGLVLIGATADPTRHPRLTGLYSGFAALLPHVGADRMARIANGVMRGLGARGPLPDASGYAVTSDAWASIIGLAHAEQLTQVHCPVFLLAGQFDQMRVDLTAYAKACRQAYTQVIPRASHLAPLTHRTHVARALADAVKIIMA